jgi:YggT family protein
MLNAIYWLASEIISLMGFAIIVMVVLNILIAFDVVNTRNQFVYSTAHFLDRVTSPILTPIRRHLPLFGNVDLSPLVAILLLQALQYVLADIFGRLVMAGWNF